MIKLITTNAHKFKEVSKILSSRGINIAQGNHEKFESYRASIEDTAKMNAKAFAEKLRCPVLVDDSGIEFSAYDGFPAQNSRWAFETLGYAGLLRLLNGKSRKAVFRCAASYCEPGKKPLLAVGELKGKISERVYAKDKKVMVYERIFIPDRHRRVMAMLDRDEKNRISHRFKAFSKIGEMI